MLARLVGFAPHVVTRMPRAATWRLHAFGAAGLFSVALTFFGLGELFRAALGPFFGVFAGTFLAVLHFFVLRILVAGGGMSLSVSRREAARWRAGRGAIFLFAAVGSFAAQGIVVMALEAPLAGSVSEHREALFEVRRQSVAQQFDDLAYDLRDEELAFQKSAQPSEIYARYTEGEKVARATEFVHRKAQLEDRRHAADRELNLYRDHLWSREFEGRRIAEAWRSHWTTASQVTFVGILIAALPALLRVLFRSAFSSYYARRWESDRRLVLRHHSATVERVRAELTDYLRAVSPDAPIPEFARGPYVDPAFMSELRAGHGLVDGRVVDTTHTANDLHHGLPHA